MSCDLYTLNHIIHDQGSMHKVPLPVNCVMTPIFQDGFLLQQGFMVT